MSQCRSTLTCKLLIDDPLAVLALATPELAHIASAHVDAEHVQPARKRLAAHECHPIPQHQWTAPIAKRGHAKLGVVEHALGIAHRQLDWRWRR